MTEPAGYTITEAAALLGIAPRYLRTLIHEGRIAAVRVPTGAYTWAWMITDLTRRPTISPIRRQRQLSERLDLALPEWRAAEAAASNRDPDYAEYPMPLRVPWNGRRG